MLDGFLVDRILNWLKTEEGRIRKLVIGGCALINMHIHVFKNSCKTNTMTESNHNKNYRSNPVLQLNLNFNTILVFWRKMSSQLSEWQLKVEIIYSAESAFEKFMQTFRNFWGCHTTHCHSTLLSVTKGCFILINAVFYTGFAWLPSSKPLLALYKVCTRGVHCGTKALSCMMCKPLPNKC